MVFLFKSKNML